MKGPQMKKKAIAPLLLLILFCTFDENRYDPVSAGYIPPSFAVDTDKTSFSDGDTIASDSVKIFLKGNDRANMFRWRLDSSTWSAWENKGDEQFTVRFDSLQNGKHTIHIQTCYSTDGDIIADSLRLFVGLAPVIQKSSSENLSVISGHACTLWVEARGTAPLRYEWFFDSTLIDSPNNDSLLLQSVSSQNSGSYFCRVSNTCGETVSNTISLVVSRVFSVTYRSNGASSGEPPTDTNVYMTGDSATIKGNTQGLRKEGYSFAGWNTAPDGKGIEYDLGSKLVFDSSDVTLYAEWIVVENDSVIAPLITAQTGDTVVNEGSDLLIRPKTVGTNLHYRWKHDGAEIDSGDDLDTVGLHLRNITPEDSGTYVLEVWNSLDTVQSGPILVTVRYRPRVITHPLPCQVLEGTDALFEADAVANPPVTNISWLLNGAVIPGAEQKLCSLSTSMSMDGSTVRCIFRNDIGSDTTESALLRVDSLIVPPTIHSHPANQCVVEGGSATLILGAEGTSLKYQWYKDETKITGATLPVLFYSPVSESDNGSEFFCVVSNRRDTMSSDTAILTLCVIPSIYSQPEDKEVCEGENVTLTTAATGTEPFNFQWRKNGVNIQGATSCSLTITSVSPADSGRYQCSVRNCCGNVLSAQATVTVRKKSIAADHIIASHDTICKGTSDTLSVSGGRLGYGAQWVWYDDTVSNSPVGEGEMIVLTPDSSSSYYVRAEGPCDTTPFCGTRIHTLNRVVIDILPGSKSACVGEAVVFRIKASGDQRRYQWRKDREAIEGARDSIYVIPSVAENDSGVYSCVVYNRCCTLTTIGALLTVYSPSTAAQRIVTSREVVCTGMPDTLRVVGGSLGQGAQWVWYDDTSGGNRIGEGETLIDMVDSSSSYYVRAEGLCDTTDFCHITVNPIDRVTLDILPGSQEVCLGEPAEFRIKASGPNRHYQWKKNREIIEGANDSSYVIASVAAQDTGRYSCVVWNACCTLETMIGAMLRVNSSSVAPQRIEASQDTICVNYTDTLKLIGGNLGSGSEWVWYTDTLSEQRIGNGESVIVSPDSTTCFFVRAEGMCDTTDFCEKKIITIANGIRILEQPSNKTICAGDDVRFTVKAEGENLNYQWKKDGTEIDGAVDSILVFTEAQNSDQGVYACAVWNQCGSEETENVQLTIRARSIIPDSIIADRDSMCYGSTILLSVKGGELGTGAQWMWYDETMDDIPFATGDSVYVTEGDMDYYVRAEGVCDTTAYLHKRTFFYDDPSISDPTDKTVRVGDDVTFHSVADATLPLMYQWYKDEGLIDGANESFYSVSNVTVTDRGQYRCAVIDGCGSRAISEPALLDIAEYNYGVDLTIDGTDWDGTNSYQYDTSLVEEFSGVGNGIAVERALDRMSEHWVGNEINVSILPYQMSMRGDDVGTGGGFNGNATTEWTFFHSEYTSIEVSGQARIGNSGAGYGEGTVSFALVDITVFDTLISREWQCDENNLSVPLELEIHYNDIVNHIFKCVITSNIHGFDETVNVYINAEITKN